MFQAEVKRRENIVAYLLYMWQIEDHIRAASCDINRIREIILPQYHLSATELAKVDQWYQDLTNMMLLEGLREKGHLEINRAILIDLERLHNELLANPQEYIYASLHYQVLPAIIQLKGKMLQDQPLSEIEICLNAVYGYLTLRMTQKEISQSTQESIQQISNFLAMLAHKYNEENNK